MQQLVSRVVQHKNEWCMDVFLFENNSVTITGTSLPYTGTVDNVLHGYVGPFLYEADVLFQSGIELRGAAPCDTLRVRLAYALASTLQDVHTIVVHVGETASGPLTVTQEQLREVPLTPHV